MFGKDWQQTAIKISIAAVMTVCLILGLVACGGKSTPPTSESSSLPTAERNLPPEHAIAEVSPPAAIQELRQALEIHQPQVKILNPQPGQVLQDDSASVEVQVQDFPIFKDEKLGLGPHLHIILDNTLERDIYDLTQPLILSDLSPGTHTLRVFASRPWHESFKNEGAYAQTTFHIFTPTPNNTPNPALPLLTYSRPTGKYGAEPVMLDFYLTNAPLHFVAQENTEDDIIDWRIRCTIDGQSFVLDRWHPLYLTGLKPGKNWVKLEFLDEFGNPVENVFNTTARTIVYEPGGNDTLSQLVTGKLSAAAARRIVDPNSVEPTAPDTETAQPEEIIPDIPAESGETVPTGEILPPEAESLSADEESVPAVEPAEEQETAPPAAIPLPAEGDSRPDTKFSEPGEAEESAIPEVESLLDGELTIPEAEFPEVIAPEEALPESEPLPLEEAPIPADEFPPLTAPEEASPESEPLPLEEAPIPTDESPEAAAAEEAFPETEPLPIEEAPIPEIEFPEAAAAEEAFPETEPLPLEEAPIPADEFPEGFEPEETVIPEMAAPIEEDVSAPESAPIEEAKTGTVQKLTQGVKQLFGRFLGREKDVTVEPGEAAVPEMEVAPIEEDVAASESAPIEEANVPEMEVAPIEEDVAAPESAPIEESKAGFIQKLIQGVKQFFGSFLGDTVPSRETAP